MKNSQSYRQGLGSTELLRLALSPYRNLGPYYRKFARFKILLDPMFPRVADFICPGWNIIDVGCGYGVTAAWLLAVYPDLRYLACEPDAHRARIAAQILDSKGEVLPCRAQDLPLENKKADAVLCLDMLHYLPEGELRDFLNRVRPVLTSKGRLIIRVTIPGKGFRLLRLIEIAKLKIKGIRFYYRGIDDYLRILLETGFRLELMEPSAPGSEELWLNACVENC